MDNLFLDIESYYDRKYSLKKMPTMTYVRDPRFQFLGCAIIDTDESSARYISDEAEFRAFLETVDWPNTRVIAHNTLFDGTVLTERFGKRPAKWGCTVSMARPILTLDSYSLDSISRYLHLGEKGDALVEGDTDGERLRDYATNDVVLSYRIYHMLRKYVPDEEMELISLTIRMGVEPTFIGDIEVLQAVRDKFADERQTAIEVSGFDEIQLSSNQRFAKVVEELCGSVPMKESITTGEETAALGKNDPEFQALMADFPQYSHVWEARLAAKSNIQVSRADKLIEIAKLGRTLPMPYNYCGAGTTRWSGADGLNVQNLPRFDKSEMRRGFRAPDGYLIGAADSAGIELRVNMWWSNETEKLDLIRKGGDLYVLEAATQFNIPESEVTKQQRQFGKVIQLGCGYGMGADKFRAYCAAGPLGMKPIHLTEKEASKTIRNYRLANKGVKESWAKMDELLRIIYTKPQPDVPYQSTPYKCVELYYNLILLPNNLPLLYSDLEWTEQNDWRYGTPKRKTKIYGAKLQENIVQALARVIIGEQALEIDKKYRVLGLTHDEIIFLVPENEREEAEKYALQVMSASPKWALDLPLDAECEINYYYAK